jgi:hypothetical protein
MTPKHVEAIWDIFLCIDWAFFGVMKELPDQEAQITQCQNAWFILEFYVLLTMHLGTNLVNNQLDAQFLCICFTSLHVSSNPVLIIRRINCINTTSGVCHSLIVCDVLSLGFKFTTACDNLVWWRKEAAALPVMLESSLRFMVIWSV